MKGQPSETPRPPTLYPVPAGVRGRPCKSCGMAIIFTRTDTGRAIPLSIEHEAARWEGDQVLAAPSHFIDCPQASSHSRPKPKKD